jgi:hypothetical protein
LRFFFFLFSGEFPNTTLEALKEIQLTFNETQSGIEFEFNPNGLYDIRRYREMVIVQGCGVGGTSLINANVVMPAIPRVYQVRVHFMLLLDGFFFFSHFLKEISIRAKNGQKLFATNLQLEK